MSVLLEYPLQASLAIDRAYLDNLSNYTILSSEGIWLEEFAGWPNHELHM